MATLWWGALRPLNGAATRRTVASRAGHSSRSSGSGYSRTTAPAGGRRCQGSDARSAREESGASSSPGAVAWSSASDERFLPSPLVDYSPGRFDARRVVWEDDRVFGGFPPETFIPVGHLLKREELLRLSQATTLDEAVPHVRALLDFAEVGLTTANYSQILLTTHALAGFAASPPLALLHASSMSASGLADLVWRTVLRARSYRWLLTTRAYNCALLMLCALDDERCAELFAYVRSLDDVIMTEQSYAPYLAFLHRRRRPAQLLAVWKDMVARHEAQLAKWDVSVAQLLRDWVLDDDKHGELAALATRLPCQQMWMFNQALNAALTLGQTNTAAAIVEQLHAWRRRYREVTQRPAPPLPAAAPSFSSRRSAASDTAAEPVFEHVMYRPLMVEPRWTASTFQHTLTLLGRRGSWAALLLTIGSMARARLLHPLRSSTAALICQAIIAVRRWTELRVLVAHLRQAPLNVSSLDALSAVLERVGRAARAEPGEAALQRALRRLLVHLARTAKQRDLIKLFSHTAALNVRVDLCHALLHDNEGQAAALNALLSGAVMAHQLSGLGALRRQAPCTPQIEAAPVSHTWAAWAATSAPTASLPLSGCCSLCALLSSRRAV